MLTISSNDDARHVLVVDSDQSYRRKITEFLAAYGLVLSEAADATGLSREIAARPTDLVILDVVLDGADGLAICGQIAAAGGPPLLILSAADGIIDKVLGLEFGADDYLAKSCDLRELLARVRAILRRTRGRASPAEDRLEPAHGAKPRVDVSGHQLVGAGGEKVLLSRAENALLSVLMQRSGKVINRACLLEALEDGGEAKLDRSVDTQISRLRKKFQKIGVGNAITTVRGVGYLFEAPF